MKKMLVVLGVFVLFFGFTVSANAAISISIYDPTNSPISSLTIDSIIGNTINITETWTDDDFGFLLISGLTGSVAYTLNKTVINMTGIPWSSFSNELLDPTGGDYLQANNDSLDPASYPSWVPPGYTTSNDADGLSFAQYSGIPRTSVKFSGLIVDELDERDFLDFHEGLVYGSGGSAGTDTMSFGLIDKSPSDNSPFLLGQFANKYGVIPEPASMSLLGMGLLGAMGLVGFRRKK